MKILALDLGKFKTVSVVSNGGEPKFVTLPTDRREFTALLQREQPDVVVFETCTAAGWLADLCEELGIEFLVANPNGEAWRWSRIKRKTDRDDALKLLRMTQRHELPTVHMPSRAVRAKRSLLNFRQAVIGRRVAVQNEIRALWQAQGIADLPPGAATWTQAGLQLLREQCRPLAECAPQEFWRGQLGLLVQSLEQMRAQEKELDQKLQALAKQDAGVQKLMTINGVGRCTAEVVCAWIDNPRRFQNSRQVSSCVGMVPRQYQSGESDRRGRITKQGNSLLRKTLVECAWLMQRYNPWAVSIVQRISQGQKTRKKQAIVALARKLLVRCWAMLRDGTDWKPEPTPAT